MAIGLAGATVVVGPDALTSLGLDAWAQIACITAAMSYAFASIYGRRFRVMGVAPMVTAAGQVTASTLILLPIALMIERPWVGGMPSMAAVGAVVGLGTVSTAVAYVLFFHILAASGAVNLMLVTLLTPVSAILMGVSVLGVTLLTRHFVGMALIGIGLSCIDGRLLPRQSVSSSTSR